MIDDFWVESSSMWKNSGAELIKEIKKNGKQRGEAQILVVCGAHDDPRREFLKTQNLTIASEGQVGEIK